MKFIIGEIYNTKVNCKYARILDLENNSIDDVAYKDLKVENNGLILQAHNKRVYGGNIVFNVPKVIDDNLEEKNKYTLIKIKGNKYLVSSYEGVMGWLFKKDIVKLWAKDELKECNVHETSMEIRNLRLGKYKDESIVNYIIDKLNEEDILIGFREFTMPSIDPYNATNENYKRKIDYKYRVFIANSNYMGLGDMSFIYEIRGEEVRLLKYTGTSESPSIPSFVTEIGELAFADYASTSLRCIELREGLKRIENGAFSGVEIDKTMIPRSVIYIGKHAFL